MEGLRGGGESRKPYLQTDPKQKPRLGRHTLFLSPKTTLIAVVSLWNHKCGLHPFSSCPLFSPHPLQSPSLSSFHSFLPPSCCNLPSLLFWILPKLPNWPLSLRIIFSPTSALTASRRNVLNFISDAGCPWLTLSSGSLLLADVIIICSDWHGKTSATWYGSSRIPGISEEAVLKIPGKQR